MKIICPNCGADYSIDNNRVPSEGLQVDCPSCGESFMTPPPEVSLGDGSLHDSEDISMEFDKLIEDDPFLSEAPPPTTLYVRTAEGQVVGPYDADSIKQLIATGRFTGGEDASHDQRVWMPLKSFSAMSTGTPRPLPGAEAPAALAPPREDPGGLDEFDFSFSEANPGPSLEGPGGVGDFPANREGGAAEPDDFDFGFMEEDGLPAIADPRGPGLDPTMSVDDPVSEAIRRRARRPTLVGADRPEELDISDLPAPVVESQELAPRAIQEISDLPAPKAEVSGPPRGFDGPFGELSDLPGPRSAPAEPPGPPPMPPEISDLPGPVSQRGGPPPLPPGFDPPPMRDLPEEADLPALKQEFDLPARRDSLDLPAPRVHVDLPAPQTNADLPGLTDLMAPSSAPTPVAIPGAVSVPVEPGGAGLAASGVVSPQVSTDLPAPKVEVDLPAPKVPIGRMEPVQAPPADAPDLPAPKGAIDRFEHMFDQGVPAGAVLDTLEEPRETVPPDQAQQGPVDLTTPEQAANQKKRFTVLGSALAGVVVLALGGAYALGLGPFAGEDPNPKRPDPRAGRTSAKPAIPTTHPPDQPPMAPVDVTPTLVEVTGYRGAIARVEQQPRPTGEAAAERVELYAFGALEFPGHDGWTTKASQMAEAMDDATRATDKGARARLVAGLASKAENAIEDAIKFGEDHPEDARSQYLLGHAHRLRGDMDAAVEAFRKATTLDKALLPAWRMRGEAALDAGRVDEAERAFDQLEKTHPRAPATLLGRAAIALQRSRPGEAKARLDEALKLPEHEVSARTRARTHTLSARVALEQGQPEAAIQSLEKSIRVWPGNLEAINLLSKQLFAREAWDQALAQFQKLRSAGVRGPEIAIGIARSEEGLKRVDKAREELASGIEAYPRSGALHSAVGDLEYRRGKYGEARKAYEKALEIDPEYHEAHLKIAAMMVSRARVLAAIEHLKEALKANETSPTLHFGLGELELRVGSADADKEMLAAAESRFRRALELDPSFSRARRALAITLIEKGDAHQALTELEKLRARPDYVNELDFELGRAHLALGNYNQAIVHYNDALKRDPEDPRYLLAAGTAYFEKGDLKAAEEKLKAAAAKDSTLTDSHFQLGRVAFARENMSEAVRRFKLAHDESKSNLEYHYWLARSLESTGKRDQAYQAYDTVAERLVRNPRVGRKLHDTFYRRGRMRLSRNMFTEAGEDFRRVLDYDDRRAEVWLAYGETFMLSNKYDEAIRHFKQAVKLDRALARGHWLLAQALLRQEKVDEAIPALEEAASQDTKLADPLYSLCIIYRDKGRRGKAKKACQSYLERDPKGFYADEVRRELRSL